MLHLKPNSGRVVPPWQKSEGYGGYVGRCEEAKEEQKDNPSRVFSKVPGEGVRGSQDRLASYFWVAKP